MKQAYHKTQDFPTNSNGIGASSIVAEAESFFDENEEIKAEETEAGANQKKLTVRKYPVLSEKAFYGLAGEIVKIIEPHTEADSAALLIQLLTAFGSVIGRNSYFKVGADFHYTKLFAVLVGATARGRKGTSWSEVERILVRVDGSFRDCIHNGMSSGEGLIFQVRDKQTKKTPVRKQGRIIDYQDEIVDEGTKEKRCCVIEPEFARVLRVIKREHNTLSAIIRDAWDKDRLKVMTKNPINASGTHISIVGHITESELIRNLDETETANGFANRFLWLCVKRSKYLPDGGNLQESDLNSVVSDLRLAVNFAAQGHELKRDSEANQLWHRVYRRLSDGYAGLLGSVTSRATAQVMRLACLYALLDTSSVIRVEHLRAALALWQYCEDSAKYIFGLSLGDKIADEIYSALKETPAGMTKTDLSNRFNRNRTAAEIDAALETLLELERIENIEEQTKGRPREIFRATGDEINEINEISLEIDEQEGLNSLNSFNSYGGVN
ncbi:MAG TPA: DUF3987 domain-containing protein [Pyrinomonadaceae bacterium]|nr:DUF3987 domain-containing protein [Pyrinomonadaceae bacterium]